MRYISACSKYCEKNGMPLKVFKKTDVEYDEVRKMMNDNPKIPEKPKTGKKMKGKGCEKSSCSCQSGHGLFTLLASVGIPLLVDAITSGSGLNRTGQGEKLSMTEKNKLKKLFEKELKKSS